MVGDKRKEECCGCSVCEQICPVNAITMKDDSEGFSYPQVDESVCIHCEKCNKVCPLESNYNNEDANPAVYAAIYKDETICRKSSSGGAFTAISNVAFQSGGNVYGVKFDENFHVVHAAAETPYERNKFRGSKYVQSDMREICTQIEQNLSQGKKVIFTGTPCQVEAVLKYIKLKKISTENFYTIDNICHGVGSPKLWNEYIAKLKSQLREGEQLKYITMRGKKAPWRKQEMEVITDQRNISGWINQKFSWNRLVLTLFPMRPSCFSCCFTSYKRTGDLTLADFWNFENAGIELDDTNGVSLVLVNSQKGAELFEQAKEQLHVVESNKKACWQIHLEFPNNKPSGYSKFWKDYEKKGAEYTLQKYTKGSAMNKLIRFVSPMLRKLGLYTLIAQLYYKIGKRK